MNIENLKKYRAGFKKLMDNGTIRQATFDMESLRSKLDDDGNLVSVEFKGIHSCGTIGCAMGWAPFIFPDSLSDDLFNIDGELDFIGYSERLFDLYTLCLLYTSPSPRDQRGSRMPSSA